MCAPGSLYDSPAACDPQHYVYLRLTCALQLPLRQLPLASTSPQVISTKGMCSCCKHATSMMKVLFAPIARTKTSSQTANRCTT